MRRVALVVLILALLATALAGRYWLGLPATPLKGGDLDIPRGASAAQIGERLRSQQGLTLPIPVFLAYVRAEGIGRTLRAGEYRVAPQETLRSVLQRMVRGDVVRRKVTLVEGWRWQQFLAALRAAPRLEATLGSDEARVRAQLGITDGALEGQFLPETYTYVAGMRDRDVLLQSLQAQRSTLAKEWAARDADLPYREPREALIVASMIEKETGRADDRGAIARVFVERLRRGMKLQSDPTVIYALGNAYTGNLTRADLQIDSPFNTYVYAGLPPTPIAAPGAAAIHAALHPAPGDYLYFVARGDGSSEFSASLQQHNAAVNQFQRKPSREKAR